MQSKIPESYLSRRESGGCWANEYERIACEGMGLMNQESGAIPIKRVLNDGKNLIQRQEILTFLTTNGWRTPQYIYVGMSDGGIEIAQPTKRDCEMAIARDNRLFGPKRSGGE